LESPPNVVEPIETVAEGMITDWLKLDVDIECVRVCLNSGIGITWRFKESVSRNC
jgi:hypothetical protein